MGDRVTAGKDGGRKRERIFRFKQFSVSHGASSMPVGVDGVMVAAWADYRNIGAESRILDIGTGCGLIALIAAQRSKATITAIDIDQPSIDEASINFRNSPWSDRLVPLCISLSEFTQSSEPESFDLIISNPPYFSSGIDTPDTPRLRARHESSLPLEQLAADVAYLLNPRGDFAVILPALEIAPRFIGLCRSQNLSLVRKTDVRCFSTSSVKRSLLHFRKSQESAISEPVFDELIMEYKAGEPTEDYRALCGDLYLKY